MLLDVSMDDMDGWETARRIRAAGQTEVPVIMVSANAFENRPDILAEAGCQGFVDKPVIESELLEMLQRHLHLVWVAELAVPAWTPAPAARPVQLPAEPASELMRLARLGHMQGLHRVLDDLVAGHPAAHDDCVRLRALLERFELDEFMNEIARGLGATQAEAW